MKASLRIVLAVLASPYFCKVISANKGGDACFDGERFDGCDDNIPFYCKGRNEAESTPGTCFSEGLCCCESRDGLFANTCQDGDICCDGGCCNADKSFCCGGGCCDLESEVCCRGECIGGSSKGTRRWFPTIIHSLMAVVAFVFVGRAPKDLRLGRLTSYAVFFAMMGFLQIVVGVAAWDCSGGIKFLVTLGTVEAVAGLSAIFLRMGQAYSKKQAITSVFGMERFVMVVADAQGNVKEVAVADQETMQVARTELASKNKGSDNHGAIALRLQDTTEGSSE